MKKVLYIEANPKAEEDSVSKKAGRAFLDAYQQKHPDHDITEIDLFKTPVQGIDQDVMSAWGALASGAAFTDLSPVQKQKVQAHSQVTEQFIGADVYIFVNPLWNFSLPAEMKQYVDAMMIAGKTFKYTENGPVGLLEGKKAIHVQASGGVYSQGPAAEMEMGHRYLTNILRFVGVTDMESILIEGTNAGRTADDLEADIAEQVKVASAAV